MFNKISTKRQLCAILILVLVIMLGACGTEEKVTEEKVDAVQEPEMIVIGTGGISGVWYPVGGAIASALSNSAGVTATAQASAGSVENIRLLSNGEIEMGISNTSVVASAVAGEEAFVGEPVSNIRGIAIMLPIQTQMIVRDDSDIKSLYDLKGKSVGVGQPGSGDEVQIRQMLETIGITYDDIDEKMLSYSELVTSFKDKQIDAMFVLSGAPTSVILDAASQEKIRILPVEDTIRDKVIEKFPFNVKITLAANTYQFQTEPVELLQLGTLLFCDESLSEDVVYRMTKALFDNVDKLQASHNQMATFSLETAIDGMPVDLHPGAEKYYKEAGLIK